MLKQYGQLLILFESSIIVVPRIHYFSRECLNEYELLYDRAATNIFVRGNCDYYLAEIAELHRGFLSDSVWPDRSPASIVFLIRV